MGEAKPFASLSSGLLARKGTAKPAMRRPAPTMPVAENGQDDLGWNDMGYDVDPDFKDDREADYDHKYNPLSGAIPDADPGQKARQHEVAERLNGAHAEAIESELEVEIAQAEAAEEHQPVASDAAAPVEMETQEIAPELISEPSPLAVKPKKTSAPIATKTAAIRMSTTQAKAKTAFTLRLDAERHLKLRLACAVGNVSAQKLVTGALDDFLKTMPEIDELVGHVPGRTAQ